MYVIARRKKTYQNLIDSLEFFHIFERDSETNKADPKFSDLVLMEASPLDFRIRANLYASALIASREINSRRNGRDHYAAEFADCFVMSYDDVKQFVENWLGKK